ncbi:MAG: hypothetical protein IPN29_17650 [Saprospiraceae bacterium]|nr:hypothetical protein [Saprospiraceae bacterium]
MKRITSLGILLLGFQLMNSQVLDEEIGFRLVKAEYLINTERFEDAIKELNEIIKENSNYKNALLLRAETKYRLAAYKGAKGDVLEYLNVNGITGKAASILGKSDFAMGADEAAFNSVTAGIALGEKEARLFEIRAEIYERRNQKISACEDWQAAARLGSTKGAINARKNCGVKNEIPTNPPAGNDTHVDNDADHPDNHADQNAEPGDTSVIRDTEVVSEGTQLDTTAAATPANTNENPANSESGPDLLIPEEDNSVNAIVIDEELTLEIFGQGLGKRGVLERPSILILAEKDGVVTVEICVNAEGRVDYAEFDASKSTLNQNSLVSLAIRKAKEFWFEDSDYPKQCGFIRFKIKGS